MNEKQFVKELRKNFPDDKIVLTTVTKTGNAVAKQKLSGVVNEIIYSLRIGGISTSVRVDNNRLEPL